MPSPNDGRRNKKGDFRRRLGYYLTGVAIGTVMLGFFWTARQAASQRRQAQRGALNQVTPANEAASGPSHENQVAPGAPAAPGVPAAPR